MGRNPFALLPGAAPNQDGKRQVARPNVLPGFDPRRALAALESGRLAGLARVVVPFPPPGLNPNARPGHPAQKARLARAYREACRALTLEALGAGFGRRLPGTGPIRVHLDFFPPNARRRDDDNLEAAFKAGRDGIAAALGVDDARFVVTRRLRAEVRGCVDVILLPGGMVL